MSETYMQQALQLAQSRRGYCAPNPCVGTVIVKKGQVIASGRHERCGQAHAEVDALSKASGDLSDATLYVTLEPCCHWGKTPPCTDTIIQSGIKRVFYGYRDPNPMVDGGGTAALRAAGIDCEYINDPQVSDFYRRYTHWVKTGTPWVTAKLAMSLDGIIAASNGAPIDLTGDEAKRQTFLHRQQRDAILTTARTVIADDPQLNVRLTETPEFKPVYIVDRQLATPASAKLLQQPTHITMIHAAHINADEMNRLGVRTIGLPSFTLETIIKAIGSDGVHDLWVETGPRFFNALLNARLAQRALIYVAPKLIGDGLSAFDGNEQWALQNPNISWYHYGQDRITDMLFCEDDN